MGEPDMPSVQKNSTPDYSAIECRRRLGHATARKLPMRACPPVPKKSSRNLPTTENKFSLHDPDSLLFRHKPLLHLLPHAASERRANDATGNL